MVTVVEDLLRLKGQRVLLEYTDGEIVEAMLLMVDPVEHHDIVIDILAVKKGIGETYTREKVYISPIEIVKTVTALEYGER